MRCIDQIEHPQEAGSINSPVKREKFDVIELAARNLVFTVPRRKKILAKKLNGIGGLVSNNVTTREMPGVPAALKDSTGKLLASGTTDQDGWYMCTYKWTGKAVTLYLTITPSGYAAQTKSVTLKSNGYSEVDFTCP